MKSFIISVFFSICEMAWKYVLAPMFQKRLDNELLNIVKNHLAVKIPEVYKKIRAFVQENPQATTEEITLELANIMFDAGIDIAKVASPEVLNEFLKKL